MLCRFGPSPVLLGPSPVLLEHSSFKVRPVHLEGQSTEFTYIHSKAGSTLESCSLLLIHPAGRQQTSHLRRHRALLERLQPRTHYPTLDPTQTLSICRFLFSLQCCACMQRLWKPTVLPQLWHPRAVFLLQQMEHNDVFSVFQRCSADMQKLAAVAGRSKCRRILDSKGKET